MMSKEAIRILGLERDDWETSHCSPLVRREAFDMAIEALKAQDDTDTNVGDYRQAAIDHFRLIIDATNTDSRYNMGFVDGLEFCISHLSTMPSAQPERKTGEWIYDGDCYICNQCKSGFNWWADSQTSNYCPNCGADMRGKKDE